MAENGFSARTIVQSRMKKGLRRRNLNHNKMEETSLSKGVENIRQRRHKMSMFSIWPHNTEQDVCTIALLNAVKLLRYILCPCEM